MIWPFLPPIKAAFWAGWEGRGRNECLGPADDGRRAATHASCGGWTTAGPCRGGGGGKSVGRLQVAAGGERGPVDKRRDMKIVVK